MSDLFHSTSDVQSRNIGAGTRIWQFCIVLKDAIIGNNCNICSHCLIENDVRIGDNVTIKSGVQIWDGVTIMDNVFVGPNVTFTNDLIPRSKVYPSHFIPTIVEDGASIGANSSIICGITIGRCSLIGIGSVVTKDVPPYTVWYGNPAKQIGSITSDGKIARF